MIKKDVYDAVKEFFSAYPFVTISINYEVAADKLDVFFEDAVVPTCILRNFYKLSEYLETHDYNCYVSSVNDLPHLHIYRLHRFVSAE